MALSTRNVGAHDPLKFDQIILNEGLSWDTNQDRFHARYSWGTYFVAVSAGIRSGFHVYNELVINQFTVTFCETQLQSARESLSVCLFNVSGACLCVCLMFYNIIYSSLHNYTQF